MPWRLAVAVSGFAALTAWAFLNMPATDAEKLRVAPWFAAGLVWGLILGILYGSDEK